MTPPDVQPRIRWSLWLWLAVSGVAVLVAWGVPVNFRSVPVALLREAGRGTPTVAEAGEARLVSEKIGAARRLHEVAVVLGESRSERLGARLGETDRLRPEAKVYGGWDPYLDSLMALPENRGKVESLPILKAVVTERGRRALGAYLENSRSLGVQQVLALRGVPVTGRFVAVGKPGGQALESVLLLTALLYQADGMGVGLQREVREAVEMATLEKRLGGLEGFLTDLLSLGSRMNWGELVEILRVTQSVGGVGQLAQLAREAEADWNWIYAGVLMAGSSERVTGYVLDRGKAGMEDLRAALERGQGAVRLLVRVGLPVNRAANYELGWAAEVAYLYPRWVLLAKYLTLVLAAVALVRALEAGSGILGEARWVRWPGWVMGGVLGLLLIAATEPFLFRKLPLSEYRMTVSIPALGAANTPAAPQTGPTFNMETSTILSIAFFASLQVAMYLVCLRKIREIDRQELSPTVKLQLIKNEENLFDGGLYIGIGGTATALVLQVLGMIEANLLAAYSSNLFGIVCVALVKIRSVRPFIRDLIMAEEGERRMAKAEEGVE